MKLILAIIHNEDGNKAIVALNNAGCSVTKLATTGGFLRSGNMTLLVGIDEDRIPEVLEIFKKNCSTRKKIMATPIASGMAGVMSNYPVEVDVGGATIFILDVDRFEKI